MSIPRRLGRLARGFVSSEPGDDRFRTSNLSDHDRMARGRSEVLKDALEAAWRSAYEEWQRGEEERKVEEARVRDREAENARNYGTDDTRGSRYTQANTGSSSRQRDFSTPFTGRKYPPEVLRAYERLDLVPGVPISEVDIRRRAMIKKFHPDRFTDPEKRMRAERVTADINAAHDLIERHALKNR